MAKKKTLDVSKKSYKECDDTEKKKIELIVRNADMISTSIKMAGIMQQSVNIGPEGITTTMVYVIGDFIKNLAYALEADQEACFKGLMSAVRDYLKEKTKTEGS